MEINFAFAGSILFAEAFFLGIELLAITPQEFSSISFLTRRLGPVKLAK